jgi:hypothetical protein
MGQLARLPRLAEDLIFPDRSQVKGSWSNRMAKAEPVPQPVTAWESPRDLSGSVPKDIHDERDHLLKHAFSRSGGAARRAVSLLGDRRYAVSYRPLASRTGVGAGSECLMTCSDEIKRSRRSS